MSPSSAGIEVQRVEEISNFGKDAIDYLIQNHCPEEILPYPFEFEIIEERHRGIAKELKLCVFRQSGKLIGYAPYLRRRSVQHIRFGEKTVSQLTFDAIQILRPNSAQWGHVSGTSTELLLFLLNKEPKIAITIPELDVQSELWQAVKEIASRKYLLANDIPFEHYLHCFVDNYDAFYQTKSANSKKQIKYKTNVLKKRVGPQLVLKEYADEESLEQFLKNANSISVKTYQAELFGEVVEDSLEMRRLLGLYARNGYFRSFILWADQIPIAFALGTQTPDGLYELHVMGYDPDWTAYSAGFNCTLKIVQRLYEHNTPKCLDIGGGKNDLKRLFSNNKTQSVSPVLLPKSLHGIALYQLVSQSERTNRWIVSVLEKIGLKAKIKQWLRRW